STDYIVHSGGNTRLLVLKELYRETNDERFSRIQCLFRPWNRESDLLLAHLRENDLRGGLIFIDKALAVFEIKHLLEAELEIDTLSQRRLQSALKAGGYALNHPLISRMGYAVEVLLPLIPQALNSGLGRPQVQRIRALERGALRIWKKHALGDEDAFNQVFATLCRRYDAPEWDTDLLRSAIETEIAEQAEISVHTIRVELDARIEGRELIMPEFAEDGPPEAEPGETDCLAGVEPNPETMNSEPGPVGQDSLAAQPAELPDEIPDQQSGVVADAAPEPDPDADRLLDDEP
ncbi:MAG: chromosome partitioning protein ParB, partial [Gammaproteobacteria bacterium]|nr:chromosome partitioning protein ParB [Gammaproteobacteria bacterium]